MLGVNELSLFALTKLYTNVGHRTFNGTFSPSVEYDAFSKAFSWGALVYMPLWNAAASALFITAKERAALPRYSADVRNSQENNQSTIFRRAYWNMCLIPEKMGLNSLLGLAINSCVGLVNGAIVTYAGARMYSINSQTAMNMSKLGAASGCLVATICIGLNLSIRYAFYEKPTLLPDFETNEVDSDCSSDDESLSGEFSPDSKDLFFSMLVSNLKNNNPKFIDQIFDNSYTASKAQLRKFE